MMCDDGVCGGGHTICFCAGFLHRKLVGVFFFKILSESNNYTWMSTSMFTGGICVDQHPCFLSNSSFTTRHFIRVQMKTVGAVVVTVRLGGRLVGWLVGG